MWFILILSVGFATIISIVLFSWYVGISPAPTSRSVREAIAPLIPKISGKVVDLGSGFGDLALLLKGHEVTGYEISPIPWFISKLRARGRVRFIYKNFYTVNLGDVDLVVCYLYSEGMLKLKEKFEQELKGGAYILTHTFCIPGWSPIASARASDIYRTPIYLYRITPYERQPCASSDGQRLQ